MSEKIFTIFINAVLFFFVYGLFGGVYAGVALSMDGAAQLVTIGLYAIYSAAVAVWLIAKANKEPDVDKRRFGASAALAFILLFISCGLAFLEPGTLLSPGVLWLALKVCGGTVAVIVTGALVMAAIFALQGDD